MSPVRTRREAPRAIHPTTGPRESTPPAFARRGRPQAHPGAEPRPTRPPAAPGPGGAEVAEVETVTETAKPSAGRGGIGSCEVSDRGPGRAIRACAANTRDGGGRRCGHPEDAVARDPYAAGLRRCLACGAVWDPAAAEPSR